MQLDLQKLKTMALSAGDTLADLVDLLAEAQSSPPAAKPDTALMAYSTNTVTLTFTAACSGECPRCYAVGIACQDRLPPLTPGPALSA